jgi:hypothetical protein
VLLELPEVVPPIPVLPAPVVPVLGIGVVMVVLLEPVAPPEARSCSRHCSRSEPIIVVHRLLPRVALPLVEPVTPTLGGVPMIEPVPTLDPLPTLPPGPTCTEPVPLPPTLGWLGELWANTELESASSAMAVPMTLFLMPVSSER